MKTTIGFVGAICLMLTASAMLTKEAAATPQTCEFGGGRSITFNKSSFSTPEGYAGVNHIDVSFNGSNNRGRNFVRVKTLSGNGSGETTEFTSAFLNEGFNRIGSGSLSGLNGFRSPERVLIDAVLDAPGGQIGCTREYVM